MGFNRVQERKMGCVEGALVPMQQSATECNRVQQGATGCNRVQQGATECN